RLVDDVDLHGHELSAFELGRVAFVVDRHGFDLARLDLLERDRQRLARHRRDLRRHDLAETLTELVVGVVDLAGTLRRKGDQRELRTHAIEELLHARLHEVGAALGHVGAPASRGQREMWCAKSAGQRRSRRAWRIAATSSTARDRTSFTTTASKSLASR